MPAGGLDTDKLEAAYDLRPALTPVASSGPCEAGCRAPRHPALRSVTTEA